MSDPVSDPSEVDSGPIEQTNDPAAGDRFSHADKYNDPRARVTARGIWIGLAIVVLAAIGAVGSIYARKTQLEETRRFWGESTVTALQLGERIQLLPRGDSDFETVELTAMPGLGHLRRALLDERNYRWDSQASRAALADCSTDTALQRGASNESSGDRTEAEDPLRCIQLRLTDPTAGRFEPIEIDIDLQSGWVGPSGEMRSVRLDPRIRGKLENFFSTIINYETRRYDERD